VHSAHRYCRTAGNVDDYSRLYLRFILKRGLGSVMWDIDGCWVSWCIDEQNGALRTVKQDSG
jgi:hypothetical protein